MKRISNTSLRLAGLLLLLVGCGTPQPPQLQTGDAPYENRAVGIRFLPPSGWKQMLLANHDVFAGKVPRELPMVRYRLLDGKRIGVLRLSAMDLPETKPLDEFLNDRSPGLEDWQPVTPKSAPLEVGGRKAVRWSFTGRWDGQTAIKEVVAVRTGERVYTFACIFGEKDHKARDAMRQAISTVHWEFK